MSEEPPKYAQALIDEARANGMLLRGRLLAQERWLTSEQVIALMDIDANPEIYTRDLRSRGILMGAEYRKQYWHPAFQFDATGRPLSPLQELSTLLPKMGNRAAMFWLFQPTTRLGCQRPADILSIDAAAVVAAARLDFSGDPDAW